MNTRFKLTKHGEWSYFHLPPLGQSGCFHGFVTKPPPSAGEEDVRSALRAFGFETHVLMDQEHGDEVHVITDGERPTAGDGILLVEKHVAGIIKTADCLPVIIYSSSEPIAAIVHSGWSGTALGIVRNAVREMAFLGVKPQNIGALIGPGIGPCCYEVQEDVAGIFRSAGFGNDVIQERAGHLFLDLKRAIRLMLEAEGVAEIEDIDLCTYCRADLFVSARRDKGRGRQINFVMVRG
jgi:polyphenol oxidase